MNTQPTFHHGPFPILLPTTLAVTVGLLGKEYLTRLANKVGISFDFFEGRALAHGVVHIIWANCIAFDS